MRLKKLRPFMLVVVPTLLILAGCHNPLVGPAAPGEAAEDTTVYGSLVLRRATVEASTVAPDLEDLKSSVSTYTVELVHQGGEYSTIERTDYQEGDPIPNVPVGTWTVTVTGLDVDNRPVARSRSATDIAPGENALEFTLQPLQEATGILDYRLDWSAVPPTTVVDSLRVSLDPYPWGGGDTESLDFSDSGTQSLSTAGADVTVDFSARSLRVLGSTTQAGFYRMRIQPRRGNVEYAPIIEVVQVYDYLGSTKTVTLSAEELTSPPPAPTDLGVTLGDGTFDLDWTDASNTELGFRVYEGPVDGTAEGSVGPSATTIASASITGAPGAGTAVEYNVVSYNQFGESAAATITFTPLGLGSLFPTGTPGSPTAQNGSVNLGWSTFFGVDTYNLYISQIQADVDSLDPGVRTTNATAGNAASSYISLTDGTTYYWTVEAVNPEGNGTLAAPTAAFTVDATPPAGLSIDTSAPATNDTTPTIAWTGSGETGASFRWELRDSGSFLEDSATGVTATSYTVGTALAEDTYTFTIWESDAVGNESAPQSYTFEIDTTAPAAPTFTSLPPDPTNNTSVTFTVQGEPFANYAPSLSGATTSTPSSQLDTDSSGDETFDVGFNEGATTITATQTDQAGNVSPAASVTINVDTTPPGAPTGVASAEVTSGLTADQTPTFTWTSGGGGNDTYEYSTDNGSTWTGGVSGPTVTVPTLAPGNYTFLVREFDGAGNVSAASTGFAFEVVDTGDATITVDNPSVPSFTVTPSSDPLIVDIAGGTYSQSGTVEITSGSSITRYEWKINGTTELVGATQSTVTVDAGTGPLPASPLVFGLNTLTIIVEVDGRLYIETFQFTVVDQ